MRAFRWSLAWFMAMAVAVTTVGAALAQETSDEVATPAELVVVTLDAEAIPEQLAGILFFRKIYPTDAEISYSSAFIPPNTFARYVESGELGIRPLSETRVVRAGSDWANAEVVPSGVESIVRAGDTFVMEEVPWDEQGPQALGEMWTTGEDARVVGFAIRESSRCCSMSHSGMQSPWYGTIASGVAEMQGVPVTLRIVRWDVPAGARLPAATADMPTIRFLDAGSLTAQVTTEGTDDDEQPTSPVDFSPGRQLYMSQFADDPGALTFENTGSDPAVVYELQVEPATSS